MIRENQLVQFTVSAVATDDVSTSLYSRLWHITRTHPTAAAASAAAAA